MAKRTVSVGDATRLTHHNDITTYGDADHDWDEATGTGYHNASYDAPAHFVNVDSGNESAASMFLDQNGKLLIKSATSTTTPPTPSSESDGSVVLVDDGTTVEIAAPTLSFAGATVIDTSGNNALTLKTDTNIVKVSTTGFPNFTIHRDTKVATSGIEQYFSFDNSDDDEHEFVSLRAELVTNTAGSEDGFFAIKTINNGTLTEGLRQDQNQNIGIGATSFGTSASFVLGIANGTAPSSSPANMVQLYAEDVSTSSELKVRDEAGNITTLSPHNFSLVGGPSEDLAWAFYGERDGHAVNVDMLRLARLVEQISGEKLVYTGKVA